MKKFRKANVVIPKITPTENTFKLRRDNECLIKHLDRLKSGSFGRNKKIINFVKQLKEWSKK